MPGTRTNTNPVRMVLHGYNAAAVTAALSLGKFLIPSRMKILNVMGKAGTAGAGAGNTVLDIKRNGTSIYTTTANRPTLAAAATTGEFANQNPNIRTLVAGDVIELLVLSVSDTGHADVTMSVALGIA